MIEDLKEMGIGTLRGKGQDEKKWAHIFFTGFCSAGNAISVKERAIKSLIMIFKYITFTNLSLNIVLSSERLKYYI